MWIKVAMQILVFARVVHVTAYRLVFRYSEHAASEYWMFHLNMSGERCGLESEVMSIRHHLDDFASGRLIGKLEEG